LNVNAESLIFERKVEEMSVSLLPLCERSSFHLIKRSRLPQNPPNEKKSIKKQYRDFTL